MGPRDLKEKQYIAVRRDNKTKATFKALTIKEDISTLLDEIHNSLFAM